MPTAFDHDLGETQGRVAPGGIVPVEGTLAFVLGSDVAGRIERLQVGDWVEVTQTASFGAGVKILRCTVDMRPPTAFPANAYWKFSIRIDDVEHAARSFLLNGGTRRRVDLAANVAHLAAGARKVALRLALADLSGMAAPPEISAVSPTGGPGGS